MKNKRFFCMLLATVLVLVLIVGNSAFPVSASENSDYALIEAFLQSNREDLAEYGITRTTEHLWTGDPIPSYEFVNGSARPIDVQLYPVFDNTGCIRFFTPVFGEGERSVNVCDTFVNEINCILSSASHRVHSIAFVYFADEVDLLLDQELFFLGEYMVDPCRSLKESIDTAALQVCSGSSLSISRTLTITSSATRDPSDYSAYVTVPVIRQPSGSAWCWAACMASVVNKEQGTSYTCTSMANLFTTNQYLSVSLSTVQYYLSDYLYLTYILQGLGNLTNILSILGYDHPIIAFAANTNPNALSHMVVLRGISFDGVYTYSFMDPSPYCVTNYRSGNITNYNNSTGTGDMYFYAMANGYQYSITQYLYKYGYNS